MTLIRRTWLQIELLYLNSELLDFRILAKLSFKGNIKKFQFLKPHSENSVVFRLQSDFQSLLGKSSMTDNCSVNVGYYGDQLYAMTETNAIRRIDSETLKTLGDKTVISKYVAINHATAHPHVCEDGTVYNMGSSYHHKRGPHYVVVKVPPTFGSKG